MPATIHYFVINTLSSSIQSCLKTWGFDGNCLLISWEDSDLQFFFAHSIWWCKTWGSLPPKASSRMRRCCFSEIPESLDVCNSEAASNDNLNSRSSSGGYWLSACGGDTLTDLDVSKGLSVEGGSVTICSPIDRKGTFAASGGRSFSALSFPKTYNTLRLSKFRHRKILNVDNTL